MSDTDAPVVDAEIVPDPPSYDALNPPPSTELARRERRSEVIRPLDADQLVESFSEYQGLLPRILDASDYQQAEAGKRFVKKSGWRKIATAFDLDVQILAEEVERDDDGRILRAKTTARATAPSGRVMDGDGYCTINEFTGRRATNPKLENDLRGTAATRAKNRAISDLVGMGDVSAEEAVEASAPAETPWWTPRSCRTRLHTTRSTRRRQRSSRAVNAAQRSSGPWTPTSSSSRSPSTRGFCRASSTPPTTSRRRPGSGS
jgi:hypothetical protein